MFDIGFWELLLVGIVALVVLGPERLPGAIRSVAHWVKLVRGTAQSVKAELEQELKLQALHDDLKKAQSLNMQNLSPELQQSIDELKSAAQSVTRPYADTPASTATAASSAADPVRAADTATSQEPKP
ncbi:MAG: Sec-independent protein translocase protein TatB [Aeromonas sp.]